METENEYWEKTFEDLEMIMKSSSGDVVRYKYHPMFDDLLITCGIKYFADEAEAHWLCDIVFSYIPKIKKIEDYFFIISLSVNESEGVFTIFNEIDGERNAIVKQKIIFVDLPTGKYEFYLIRELDNFVQLCKSEY